MGHPKSRREAGLGTRGQAGEVSASRVTQVQSVDWERGGGRGESETMVTWEFLPPGPYSVYWALGAEEAGTGGQVGVERREPFPRVP